VQDHSATSVLCWLWIISETIFPANTLTEAKHPDTKHN